MVRLIETGHLFNANRPCVQCKQTMRSGQTDHLFTTNAWSVFYSTISASSMLLISLEEESFVPGALGRRRVNLNQFSSSEAA